MSDYITLSGLRTFAGFKTTDDDGLLESFITAASNMVDDYTGRTFAASGITGRTFRNLCINNYDSPFQGKVLFLDYDLAEEATSITGDPEVVYLPENNPPYYAIVITDGTWENPTTVSGYWGYSKEPSSVIQDATYRLAKWLYEMRETTRTDRVVVTENGHVLVPRGLPVDVESILENYRAIRRA